MIIYLINSIYGGFGGFSVGISFVDNKQLSNYLSSKGYPELKTIDLSNYGFGYGIFRNFVIGGFGFGGFSNSDNKSNRYTRYGLSGGAFSLGYVIYSSGKLLVYPVFNIGGYSYNLKLYEKSNGSLDDVTTNPKREVEINASNFMFGLSMNLNFFFYGGLNTYLNFGYNYTSPSKFSSESVNITDSRKFSFNNFYISLGLGMGGFVKW